MTDFTEIDEDRVKAAQREFGRIGEKSPKIMWYNGTVPTDDMLGHAIDVVREARHLLRKTRLKLANPKDTDILAWAFLYFNTDKNHISDGERATIDLVLGRTSTGLEAGVPLKLGRREDHKGRAGYTTMKPHGTDVDRVPNKDGGSAPPRYHNKVMNQKFGEVWYGAIHVCETRFEGPLAAKTLIHEASHKYAATHDYWVWKDTGGAPIDKTLVPRSDAQWKEFSLNNADSYAWFVKQVGGGF